ncbi:MAG TPA: amidase [Woeseiaceae bacterium]|nr:amidase [Woeseiaceae bacterium]
MLLCLAACNPAPLNLEEAGIADLQDRMQRGELGSEQLVHWYLERIQKLDQGDGGLNAIIETNPDALMIARALDDERRQSGPRGPMHGIPVILKANIGTADSMHTSAGSLALAEHIPPEDAFLVSRLRDAGAVILGKANLSEWANFRSSHSSSGWSSVGGQTHNPYAPRRNPCGSSSGSAVVVAANLVTVAVGTETDGSVVCPAGATGIVGIKPTLGLISRSGIVPLAHSQDTAGPMARTVRDAAILLSVMTGRDPQDAATETAPAQADYAANLAADGLRGMRIGVIRSHLGAGNIPDVERVLDESLKTITLAGAELVDDINIDMSGAGDAEYEVLLYEFKADLAKYLADTEAPVRSLEEIIAFNEAHADDVMPFFGQDILLAAEAKGDLQSESYLAALETSKRVAREGLDTAFEDNKLDALIAITNGPAWLTDHVLGDNFGISSSSYAAISGYPAITVPAGFVAGLPIGLSFIGRAYSEQDLIRIAHAFEQARAARRPPGGQ